MEVTVSDAKARLIDFVRRAEGGEGGEGVAELVPVAPRTSAKARRAVLDAVRASGRIVASHGPGAARSQDSVRVP